MVLKEKIEHKPGQKMADWAMDVIACPKCKQPLGQTDNVLYCKECHSAYSNEQGIPSLISEKLANSLDEGKEIVKHYYFAEEHYDWTRDPKALELAYHRYRKWETWKQVEKMMRPGTIALDIGCGTGLITNEFRRRFQRVIALDLNRWALSRMDGKPFVCKVQGDGEVLPIQDESVDLIVATEMIEHLEAPEKTAREIYRVLKKNGRVVGSVPSTSNIWKWRQYLSMTCGGGEPFHRNFTRSQIAKLWKDAGFKVTVKSSCLGLNWLWVLEKA